VDIRGGTTTAGTGLIKDLNVSLLLALNGVPADPMVLQAARIASSWPLIWLVSFVTLLLLWRRYRKLRPPLIVLLSVVLAVAIGAAFKAAVPLPRPMALGIGTAYEEHIANGSLPSMHATWMLSLALSMLFAGYARLFGWFMLMLAFATCWSRLYLGVHFPIDIVAALVLALAAAGFARRMRFALDRYAARMVASRA
jgi:undecaprenyl-diphosphatase